MKIIGKVLLVFLVACSCNTARSQEEGNHDNPQFGGITLDEVVFSGENPVLTPKEQYALEIAEYWREGRAMQMSPITGVDGAVEFLHGAEMPSIVCAVLQVTDIEFQPGEIINSVSIGDSTRWKLDSAISAGDTRHIIISPKDVGLQTSMIVTTNLRTYHMRLRSHRSEFMPKVRFSYVEDAVRKWTAYQQEKAADREVNTIPETNEYLGDLDFGYTIKGKAAWKPVRVYNDSVKTIIEMPNAMQQTYAPTLLIVRRQGRFMKKEELVIANYRVQNGRYIVDTLFERAVLVVGVGGNQERVEVIRNARKGR